MNALSTDRFASPVRYPRSEENNILFWLPRARTLNRCIWGRRPNRRDAGRDLSGVFIFSFSFFRLHTPPSPARLPVACLLACCVCTPLHRIMSLLAPTTRSDLPIAERCGYGSKPRKIFWTHRKHALRLRQDVQSWWYSI